ncbi:hypothetical protein ACWD4K_16825 [Streptomyces gelaticus]
MYVNDLADAIEAVLRARPDDHDIAVVAGKPCTAAALAQAVQGAVRPVPVRAVPDAEPGWHTPAGAPRPPGWTPATGLARGLHSFAQWLAYEGVLSESD